MRMRFTDIIKHYTPITCNTCGSFMLSKSQYQIKSRIYCSRCYFQRIVRMRDKGEAIQNVSMFEMVIDSITKDSEDNIVLTGRKTKGLCYAGDTLEYYKTEYTILRTDIKRPLHTGPYPIFALTLDASNADLFKVGDYISTCQNPKIRNATVICPACNNYVLTRYMTDGEICDKCDNKRKRAAARYDSTAENATPVSNIPTYEPSSVGDDLLGIPMPTTVPDVELTTIEDDVLGIPMPTAEPDVEPTIEDDVLGFPETTEIQSEIDANDFSFNSTVELDTFSFNSMISDPVYDITDITPEPEIAAGDNATDKAESTPAEYSKIREKAARYATYIPNTVRAQIEMLDDLSVIINTNRIKESGKISWDFSGRSNTYVFRDQFNKDLDTLISLVEEALATLTADDIGELATRMTEASEEQLLKASVTLDFYLNTAKDAPHVKEMLDNVYAEISSR